jgi:hypothetical protein
MQLVFPQSYSGPEMQSTMMFNKHAPSPTGFGEKRDLDPDFLPGEHDVICGKGKVDTIQLSSTLRGST